jgi:hypothetical protein
MFTVIAMALVGIVAWNVSRVNDKERRIYDDAPPDDRTWLVLLHIRQDMQLVAYLLGLIAVMLGIVADRIH